MQQTHYYATTYHDSRHCAHYIRDLAKANEISYHKSGMKYLINYPKMMEYFEAHENTAA